MWPGSDLLTTVVDNATSPNDPTPDLMSFSFIGTGVDCRTAPVLPLFPPNNGQITVR